MHTTGRTSKCTRPLRTIRRLLCPRAPRGGASTFCGGEAGGGEGNRRHPPSSPSFPNKKASTQPRQQNVPCHACVVSCSSGGVDSEKASLSTSPPLSAPPPSSTKQRQPQSLPPPFFCSTRPSHFSLSFTTHTHTHTRTTFFTTTTAPPDQVCFGCLVERMSGGRGWVEGL